MPSRHPNALQLGIERRYPTAHTTHNARFYSGTSSSSETDSPACAGHKRCTILTQIAPTSSCADNYQTLPLAGQLSADPWFVKHLACAASCQVSSCRDAWWPPFATHQATRHAVSINVCRLMCGVRWTGPVRKHAFD